MPSQSIQIVKDAAELAQQAAFMIRQIILKNKEDKKGCSIVLAGGSTPEKTYGVLAEPGFILPDQWDHVSFFMGDERLVPVEDPRSNQGMVQRTLLSKIPVRASQVHLIDTSFRTALEAAHAYEECLKEVFPAEQANHYPHFDLVLLGLGDDGHTASLFPNAAALDSTTWVTASPAGVLPPPVDRITLTLPVLNAANTVLFLVAGQNKATIVPEILFVQGNSRKYPAALVGQTVGHCAWLLDQAAAANLDMDRINSLPHSKN